MVRERRKKKMKTETKKKEREEEEMIWGKRAYFEEPRKSLTLMALEDSLPHQGWLWHQGLQW